MFIGVIPCLYQSVSDGEGGCLVSTEVVEVKSGETQGVLDMVYYGSLDGALVCADVG